MKCRKVIFYLNAYVDGELPERRRRSVEAHLAGCESCRGRLEEIRKLTELFEGTLPDPPVPDGLAPRIMAEARRKLLAEVPKRRSRVPFWNPLKWIAGLSTSMRLATCAIVLLALVVGLSLDGGNGAKRNVFIEAGKDLYGFEWFAPAPPDSIGSIYIAMANQPRERGNGQ